MCVCVWLDLPKVSDLCKSVGYRAGAVGDTWFQTPCGGATVLTIFAGFFRLLCKSMHTYVCTCVYDYDWPFSYLLGIAYHQFTSAWQCQCHRLAFLFHDLRRKVFEFSLRWFVIMTMYIKLKIRTVETLVTGWFFFFRYCQFDCYYFRKSSTERVTR